MKLSRLHVFDVAVWLFVLYLTLHFPAIETRVDDFEQQAQAREQQPPASTPRPEPPNQYLNHGKCFHMPREKCPEAGTCARVGATSVFCCDLDSARLREDLVSTMNQNTTNLHILNATIDELDISQAVFRRLTSMALTDGNIGKIVDGYTAKAYQLERDSNKEPNIEEFLKYIENRASALENVEQPVRPNTSNYKVANSAAGKMANCAYFTVAGSTNMPEPACASG